MCPWAPPLGLYTTAGGSCHPVIAAALCAGYSHRKPVSDSGSFTSFLCQHFPVYLLMDETRENISPIFKYQTHGWKAQGQPSFLVSITLTRLPGQDHRSVCGGSVFCLGGPQLRL